MLQKLRDNLVKLLERDGQLFYRRHIGFIIWFDEEIITDAIINESYIQFLV